MIAFFRRAASHGCCSFRLPPSTCSAQPLISPAPREIVWGQDRLALSNVTIQATSDAELRVARILSHEMRRQHGVELPVVSDPSSSRGNSIRLVLESSAGAKAVLTSLQKEDCWPPSRNVDDAYLLHVDSAHAVLFARTARGLVYGCQTMLQLVSGEADSVARGIAGVQVVDYPQLAFRGVHICVFPNTELAAVRQMILLASRFKYNAVVIEFWSSLRSPKRPETAYKYTYEPEQIRPLVELGQALGMEMIPMLNSWGHASGMRSRSGEHAVLDRHPEFKETV